MPLGCEQPTALQARTRQEYCVAAASPVLWYVRDPASTRSISRHAPDVPVRCSMRYSSTVPAAACHARSTRDGDTTVAVRPEGAVGGTSPTANVALIVTASVAAGEATRTVAAWVPTGSVPVAAVSVSVAGGVVLLSAADSQPVCGPEGYETVAVSPLSVPPPVFVTSSVMGAGFAPPTSAANAAVDALTPIRGSASASSSVT